jgi:hypothetical protein
MTVCLLRICFIATCTNTLLNNKRLNAPSRTVLVSRRTLGPWRNRHKRATGLANRRRRRTQPVWTRSSELRKHVSHAFAQSRAVGEPEQDRRPANQIDRAAVEHLFALNASAMEDSPTGPPAPLPVSHVGHGARLTDLGRVPSSEAMPPPPPRSADADDVIETRSTRSASTSSRSANRLSLTLPIALPTACPTRPTPASSTIGSCPPTPVETPVMGSPAEPTDFITAIAAQERRVLELREELSSAERELSRLKKDWARQEVQKKRAEIRRTEPLRAIVPQAETTPVKDAEEVATRRSVELDRRKALILGQQSAQNSPTQPRRRIFQGGHTRTLSLLSPAKGSTEFNVHEDDADDLKSPSKELDMDFHHAFSRQSPLTPVQLAKRASWAPRTVQHVAGLKQVKDVADGLKNGLWTFVEDLRQATVGDEPITGSGNPLRGVDGNSRMRSDSTTADQETIRAPASSSRPHVARAFDETPTPASRFTDPLGLDKGPDRRRKSTRSQSTANGPFTWTPLDSYDDLDWSNWDIPTVKSPRWSGSTVTGDDVQDTTGENGKVT